MLLHIQPHMLPQMALHSDGILIERSTLNALITLM